MNFCSLKNSRLSHCFITFYRRRKCPILKKMNFKLSLNSKLGTLTVFKDFMSLFNSSASERIFSVLFSCSDSLSANVLANWSKPWIVHEELAGLVAAAMLFLIHYFSPTINRLPFMVTEKPFHTKLPAHVNGCSGSKQQTSPLQLPRPNFPTDTCQCCFQFGFCTICYSRK